MNVDAAAVFDSFFICRKKAPPSPPHPPPTPKKKKTGSSSHGGVWNVLGMFYYRISQVFCMGNCSVQYLIEFQVKNMFTLLLRVAIHSSSLITTPTAVSENLWFEELLVGFAINLKRRVTFLCQRSMMFCILYKYVVTVLFHYIVSRLIHVFISNSFIVA